jgi:hypothetical protein
MHAKKAAAVFMVSLLCAPALAEEPKTVPCDLRVKAYTGLGEWKAYYTFPAFQTSGSVLEGLQDGKYVVGVEMRITGRDISYTRSNNVRYKIEGGSAVPDRIEVDDDDMTENDYSKFGIGATAQCVVLGVGPYK